MKAFATMATDYDSSPYPKRLRLNEDDNGGVGRETAKDSSQSFPYVQRLLFSSAQENDDDDATIPSSLVTSPPMGNNVHQLQELFDTHGFRTAKVSSPRSGVSVYTDRDNHVAENISSSASGGRRFLLVALGLDPHQNELESTYQERFRRRWCISLMCRKLRQTYFSNTSSNGEQADADRKILDAELRKMEDFCRGNELLKHGENGLERQTVTNLILLATKVKNCFGRFHRAEEWEREYQRICARNSTLSNVHLTMLQARHQTSITDIMYKPGEVKYERLTIFLYDPDSDSTEPPSFKVLPCSAVIMQHGVEAVSALMVELFFDSLLRLGYFATAQIKDIVGRNLLAFFTSGIVTTNKQLGSTAPLSLRARFEPSSPLAIYFHGIPGSGKSSLARYFPIALQETLTEYMDPEYIVRFVKQNFNKPLSTLELELEIRPNNNDLSLMNIIQSRKQKMSQSKRGLVVLNLEEMPNHGLGRDPNQLDVCRLIHHRFGGRKVNIHPPATNSKQNGTMPPRNASRLGIGDDFSLVTIFTSNYSLCPESHADLKQLGLFRDLTVVEMSPIEGKDRCKFATAFFVKYCEKLGASQVKKVHATRKLQLDIDVGLGDTRPLVQTLRILAFYTTELVSMDETSRDEQNNIFGIQLKQEEHRCSITVQMGIRRASHQRVKRLRCSSRNCWFPAFNGSPTSSSLDQVLRLWKGRALTPTVILSPSKARSQEIMASLEKLQINCIRNVNAQVYKMSKSLYDRKETPNLRDDILAFGRGALVAIEMFCQTPESQLLVREMVEDSPSMTAFSSAQTALFKAGLLFVLHVQGEVAPELASRISFRMGNEEQPKSPNF